MTLSTAGVTSGKRDMPGQQLRHKIIRKHGAAFDAVLGWGYREFAEKIEVLKDYRHLLTVENGRQNFYFWKNSSTASSPAPSRSSGAARRSYPAQPVKF